MHSSILVFNIHIQLNLYHFDNREHNSFRLINMTDNLLSFCVVNIRLNTYFTLGIPFLADVALIL